MENEIIESHNFDLQLKRIHDFAEDVPCELNIEKFEVDGPLFGIFDHKVTGSEMNQCVNEISHVFIQQNKLITDTIKEFDTVYKTFNVLDKEYIQGIKHSLSAAEKALDNIATAQDGIKTTQGDIKKTLGALKMTMNALKEFKQKTETDFSEFRTTLLSLQDEVSKIDVIGKKVEGLGFKTKEELAQKILNIEILAKECRQKVDDEIKASTLKLQFRKNKWVFGAIGFSIIINIVLSAFLLNIF